MPGLELLASKLRRPGPMARFQRHLEDVFLQRAERRRLLDRASGDEDDAVAQAAEEGMTCLSRNPVSPPRQRCGRLASQGPGAMRNRQARTPLPMRLEVVSLPAMSRRRSRFSISRSLRRSSADDSRERCCELPCRDITGRIGVSNRNPIHDG